MVRILLSLIGFGLGLGCVVLSGSMANLFGKIPWAEKNLGSTRSMYILIGVGTMFVSVLYMFGVISLGPAYGDTSIIK